MIKKCLFPAALWCSHSFYDLSQDFGAHFAVVPRERSELSKIIGESYFNLGNYEKAIPYLTAYKGKRGKIY
jgi:hypothetical protein